MKKLIVFITGILIFSNVMANDGPKLIPGLLPSDVYNRLAVANFVKTGPEIIEHNGNDHYRWGLRLGELSKYDIEFNVVIWALNDVDNVYRISVSSKAGLNKTTEDIKMTENLMRMLSTLNYSGAKPNQAVDWVVGNLQKRNATKVIGGVEFTVETISNDNMLTITMFEPPADIPETAEERGFISPND